MPAVHEAEPISGSHFAKSRHVLAGPAKLKGGSCGEHPVHVGEPPLLFLPDPSQDLSLNPCGAVCTDLGRTMQLAPPFSSLSVEGSRRVRTNSASNCP